VSGVDTNILVRYFVDDDAAQARVVSKIVETAASTQEALFVSLPVICELVWVLALSYRVSRDRISDVIESLLESPVFDLEQSDLVRVSLVRFRRGRAGFADYLIGAIARERGCDSVYTFDRALRGAEGFKLL
jgi:predicted nucleic-acid-binding protein